MTTDEVLVKLCCQGDKEAFATLVERYQDKIYNLTYRLVSNPEDAADLTQEVFYRAFLRIKGFRGDASFATWLYRIATNVCYDQLRIRKNRQVVSLDNTSPDDPPRDLPDQEAGPAELCMKRIVFQRLQEAIATLPVEQRTAMVLRDIQGLSYEEMAQVLQCPLGTVKSRLSRARRALKDKLMSERELFFSENVYNG
ncbi:MAG TPA: sigma-70 family RNA polymerase sigma factor [Firmicutes bacterium]|nr:sigma-70 family RNA polymerase sigma factor [Bacillota bacterium]